MLPSAEELHYFLEVAKTKNISRAAERLGIRQPSLSAAIKRLEKSIGEDLIVREKTGVQLSRAGMLVLQDTKKLIDAWENLKNAALRDKEQVAGHFTIGCHDSVASHIMPVELVDFVKQHSAIEITFQHGLSRHITEAVISWKLDIGIVVNPVQHQDLVIIKLCTDQVSFWHNPEKIQNTDLLILDPSLIQSQWLVKSVAKQQQYKRYFHTSNHEFITKMTRDGVGVGIIPARVVQIHGRSAICWVLDGQPHYSDNICLVYRREVLKSLGAKKIIELFKKTNFSNVPP